MRFAFAANAGSIDNTKLLTCVFDDFIDCVTGGSGDGRDDGT
jgi:hypothetical protein